MIFSLDPNWFRRLGQDQLGSWESIQGTINIKEGADNGNKIGHIQFKKRRTRDTT